MISRILKGWNAVKIFRVIMSALILWNGVADKNNSFILLGAGFLVFSLLSSGACCAMFPSAQTAVKEDNKDYTHLKAEYEEVGIRK
jgi:hypothetical protein